MSLGLKGGQRMTAYEECGRESRVWVRKHGCLLVCIKLLEAGLEQCVRREGAVLGPRSKGPILPVLHEALKSLRI